MDQPIRTGLFGGSFDPPTIAHLLVAEWVRDELDLAEIWFMPARVNPLKEENDVTDPRIRLNMLRASLDGYDEFVVRDDEIRRGGTSYTVDTLRELRHSHQDREFMLILGADSVHSLPRWKDHQELLKLAKIAAVVRPGWDLSGLPPDVSNAIRPVEIPPLPISSTLVRERVAAGKSIRFLVPEPVRQMIEELGLYW